MICVNLIINRDNKEEQRRKAQEIKRANQKKLDQKIKEAERRQAALDEKIKKELEKQKKDKQSQCRC